MPAHLTRHVFRALLANEPIVHRGCLRRRGISTFRRKPGVLTPSAFRNGGQRTPIPQRRTFFNFNIFARRKRDIKEAELDPGIEKMMELAKRQRMSARLPPKEEVAEAFMAFVKSKAQSVRLNRSIEDTQAALLLQSLNYCMEQKESDQETGKTLIYISSLRSACLALRQNVEGVSQHHKELIETLYRLSVNLKSPGFQRSALWTYVQYLSLNGNPRKARDLLESIVDPESNMENHFLEAQSSQDVDDIEADGAGSAQSAKSPQSRAIFPRLISRLWVRVLEGYAREGNEVDLLHAYDKAQLPNDSRQSALTSACMLDFYLRNGNAEKAQEWFYKYWELITSLSTHEDFKPDSYGTYVHKMLQWCLQSGDMERGHAIVQRVLEENPPKPAWDAIFVWAASTGKGVDEIDRMIRVMEDSNVHLEGHTSPRVVDVATINALVEFAVSKNDPYMAERFIALGREREIAPDARTYVLQMDYRLRVQDVDGALVAYKNLQASDLSSNEDIPTVNKLIVALCKSQRHDFDTIMNVAADLSDRQARFDPPTVATLGILHLNRDEFDDVVDLLNTHTYHYSSSERESIRDEILDLCIDPKTPTSRSWDAFTLIRKIFDETSREQRTKIMLNFFRRERSDMAIFAFNDMRAHTRADTIPTIDTYVAAFIAAAKLRDLDGLEVIHNQLKLDFNINVNTYLNNALMLAYTACGKARKSLSFWNDIVASKEGPTYNSIHIALRSCEKCPFGDLTAREIWKKLRRMKIDLDQSLWASYVAALAGNGDNQFAFNTIEEAEKQNELEVDSFLVGSLFAGGAGQSKQKEIEEWAIARYPHVWEQLLEIGVDEDEANMREFRIDRSLTP